MYRTICTEFWTDPRVKALPTAGKLLFLYLITNPHTHVSGIYYLPATVIQKETGLHRYHIDTLSEVEMAYFDQATETIFVKNMFAYQGRGEKNERACAKHLRTLHHSWLIGKFLECYPRVKAYLDGYPIDTLSHSGKSCPPVPIERSSSSLGGRGKGSGKGETVFPAGFQFERWMLEYAEEHGVAKAADEFDKFKAHHQAKGTRFRDWEAAYRKWILKAVEIEEERHG